KRNRVLASLCRKSYLVGKLLLSATYPTRACDARATPRHPAAGGVIAARASTSTGTLSDAPALRGTPRAADPRGSSSWHSAADCATVARPVSARWLRPAGPSPA